MHLEHTVYQDNHIVDIEKIQDKYRLTFKRTQDGAHYTRTVTEATLATMIELFIVGCPDEVK